MVRMFPISCRVHVAWSRRQCLGALENKRKFLRHDATWNRWERVVILRLAYCFTTIKIGWGGRDRTSEWWNQNPLPPRTTARGNCLRESEEITVKDHLPRGLSWRAFSVRTDRVRGTRFCAVMCHSCAMEFLTGLGNRRRNLCNSLSKRRFSLNTLGMVRNK
jgi:hypothetical protein